MGQVIIDVDTFRIAVYSPRSRVALCDVAASTYSVVRTTTPAAGIGHAPLRVQRRGPRANRPRPLSPPAPARPGEDGSPLAEEPGHRPHRDRPPDRLGPPDRAALPRRVPRRRPRRVPAAQVARPAE